MKCHLVDIRRRRVVDSEIMVDGGKIISIEACPVDSSAPFVMPGFVDAHVHVESTLLTPSNYALLAVRHGSVSAVCDPHEIANVLGVEGVEYMLESAAKTRFKFSFGVPSCVPSTCFETAGATLTSDDVERLMATGRFYGLAEMMNFPGVLNGDSEVLAKINSALSRGLLVDGHAPGLSDGDSARYVKVGITTDHEMFSIDAARVRLDLGQKIQIREGSAACNLSELMPLLDEQQYVGKLMLCTDDKYPDELLEGYINQMVATCVANGVDVWNVLYASCIAPVEHYHLNVGTLRVGDAADFIVVEDLRDFRVLQTYIDGECLFDAASESADDQTVERIVNIFHQTALSLDELRLPAIEGRMIQVIMATEGALYTTCRHFVPKTVDGAVVSDVTRDILKLVVVNRYLKAKPAIAFVNGFGLKRGAIASTIAHDSHNIIALGCSDEEILTAIQSLEQSHGGLCVVDGNSVCHLPLPVAGLMSDQPARLVAKAHVELKKRASAIGCRFNAPFMTLAFMALPVIPELKLTDKGLFDGVRFEFTEPFVL